MVVTTKKLTPRKLEPAAHRIFGKARPERLAELQQLRRLLDSKKPELMAEAREMFANADERRAE